MDTSTEQELRDRISQLEEAVKMLNKLWSSECDRHNVTMQYVIELQMRLLGMNNA